MKNFIYFTFVSQLMGCASVDIAQKLNMVTFDENVDPATLKSIGPVEGRDCTWYVAGYGVGEDPTVRNAFANAMNQKEISLVPGKQSATKGAPLKVVKNISVENTGFNAYLASRYCVVVTGGGFQ